MSPKICRPLTAAVAAAGRGTFTLDGVPRMRERPIQDLVDGLVQLGVSASCTMGTGCPPVTVEAQGLPSGTVCAPLLGMPHAITADWCISAGPGRSPALCPSSQDVKGGGTESILPRGVYSARQCRCWVAQ